MFKQKNKSGNGTEETKYKRINDEKDGGKRNWMEDMNETNDEDKRKNGRIIESQLSEHQAEGWLEGYT
ncbi:UNVERIFIED_CONTAM: hypothetical protein DV033_11355, partial [Limosilactobacillus fermentum]|nr:hypothetical protein [Limosilactobacillus fermentum]